MKKFYKLEVWHKSKSGVTEYMVELTDSEKKEVEQALKANESVHDHSFELQDVLWQSETLAAIKEDFR